MKLIKKWLFPVLTGLIVIGAAVLPTRVSQARDARQFGQVHTELLAADALPAYEPLSLTDRLELYARQYSYEGEHPVLSYHTTLYYGDPARDEAIDRAKAALTESGLLPSWYFTDEPFEDYAGPTVSRALLWNPEGSMSRQALSSFWSVTLEYHSKSGEHYKCLTVVIDDESGLPINLAISDTNMARWLPCKADAFQEFVERYFGCLGLDVQLLNLYSSDSGGLVLDYSVSGTDMGYMAEHNATIFSIGPYATIGGAASSSGFDG